MLWDIHKSNLMTAYFDALCDAMGMIATNPKTIFMGQAVKCPGTAMYRTLAKVPDAQKMELPVAEELQLGMAIGMSLNGFLPICIYPRYNFLLLALNQLVNHLDKLSIYGNGYKPKVIIRTAVATSEPLDPGPQHLGDFTQALCFMLDTVIVRQAWNEADIKQIYEAAMKSGKSYVIVERSEKY